MDDKELYNPQTGEKIAPKRPKKFYKDWRFYVYSLIAIMLAIVSFSSCLTACAAINAGVGQNEDVSYSVAQRKNALITTDGGYTGYQFSVSPNYPSTLGTYNYFTYSVDLSSYTLTQTATGSGEALLPGNFAIACSTLQESQAPNEGNTMNFLAVFGYSNYWGSSSSNAKLATYFSFLHPRSQAVRGYAQQSFILTTNFAYQLLTDISSYQYLDNTNSNPRYFISTENTNTFLLNITTATTVSSDFVFQDVASYYQELGYQDGYAAGYSEGNSDGYAAGESVGYASGYSEGLEVGNSNGEANGYANGYAAGLNASNYFKSITANNDLVFFDILANITPYYTDGNGNLYYYRIFSAEVGEDFYYCWLCYYSTSNWTQWDVYLVWCDQSSSSGFTLDYLTNHSLGVWGVPKSNGAFSSIQSYAVYNPAIQTLDNAKVSLVYNVQMMQAYVTLDGGRTYGDVYKDGYTTGYQNGYNYGYELGETAGINAAEPEALTTTLVAVFQQPFNQIYRFFNFNILGLNILGLATGLLSVFIIIKVFKKVLK